MSHRLSNLHPSIICFWLPWLLHRHFLNAKEHMKICVWKHFTWVIGRALTHSLFIFDRTSKARNRLDCSDKILLSYKRAVYLTEWLITTHLWSEMLVLWFNLVVIYFIFNTSLNKPADCCSYAVILLRRGNLNTNVEELLILLTKWPICNI